MPQYVNQFCPAQRDGVMGQLLKMSQDNYLHPQKQPRFIRASLFLTVVLNVMGRSAICGTSRRSLPLRGKCEYS